MQQPQYHWAEVPDHNNRMLNTIDINEIRQETIQEQKILNLNTQLSDLLSKFNMDSVDLSKIGTADDNFNFDQIISELGVLK
jgi:hypothetical protein